MSKKIELKDLASWKRLLCTERSSITRYEAVEFFMELSGLTPPRLPPPSPNASEEEVEAFAGLTLFDFLNEDIDWAEDEYDKARFVDDPPLDSVIEEKRKKFEKCKSTRSQALSYLRTIDDELAKGALRSPSAEGDITMISFEEWVGIKLSSDSGKQAKKLRPKQLRQEDAIKEVLISRGYDLFNLPQIDNGLDGLRKEIREELLAMTELFANRNIYEKAWDRLIARDPKEIAFTKTNHRQNSS